MEEKELGYPESTCQYLQRLRNHLISAKILHDRYEHEAEEFRKLGWHEEALGLQKLANEITKHIREIESMIAELEKQCFGRKTK